MAVSTSRLQTEPTLTTRKWSTIAAAAIVLAAVVGVVLYLMGSSGDEQPIRVRNGSMDLTLVQVTTQTNEWEYNGGDGWSPSAGKSSGLFDVKIVSSNPEGCASPAFGSGTHVSITYTDNFTATFTHHKKHVYSSKKTKVDQQDKFTNPTPPLLQHGTPGDLDHHISRVTVTGGNKDVTCAFRNDEELSEIIICPAHHSLCRK